MNIPVMVLVTTTILYASIAGAQNATKVIIFQAYTKNNVLNSDLIVAQRYTGNCFTRSQTNPARNDAWRCQASNMILDPCFEDSTSLACIVSPWSHKAAILDLDTPLYGRANKTVDTKHAQPWAIELENGQRCTFLAGASTVVDNQRINYSCGGYQYNIIGNVDRSSPVWKVNLYNFNNKNVNQLAITTAWF